MLDQTFNPSNNPNGTSPNEVDSLVESIVVPAPQTTTAATNYGNAGITPTGGDLLVLVSDSDYSSGADGASGSWDRAEPALVYDPRRQAFKRLSPALSAGLQKAALRR